MADPDLVKIVLQLSSEVRTLRRAVQGMHRFGTVHDIDVGARRLKLKFADTEGGEFLSPSRPWAEIAGAEKSWRPPSSGQQMLFVSPFGDMRQGVALPLTFSDQYPAPSSNEDERILSSFGEGLIGFSDGGGRLQMHAGSVSLGAHGGEKVARIGDKVEVNGQIGTIIEGSNKVFAA